MKHLFILFFASLFSTYCNLKNPKEHEIPEGDILPIDGIWDMTLVNQDGNKIESKSKFKFSKGRLIVEEITGFGDKLLLDKGMVYAKNIRLASKNTYKGKYYITTSRYDLCECDVEITVKNNSLVCKTNAKETCDEAVLFTEIIFTNPVLDNEQIFYTAHGASLNNLRVRILSENRIEGETQIQKVAYGASISIERSRTIKRELSFSETNKKTSGTSIGAGFNASNALNIEIQRSIMNEIEKSMGKRIEEEETYKVTVNLDGNVSTIWKLIWYDKIKQGLVNYRDDNGNERQLFFQFPVSSELEITKL
ncbi:MAG: hypothetical protein DYG98_05720 [Haliscomenobacteraceae bacterium CHB4]|nr:hypothetical protein [Haliscomenobacteraceae bacterium CHB4]